MTLDDLRHALELLPSGAQLTLPRDELLAAVLAPDDRIAETPATDAERWLTAEECASLLNVSARWCYDHSSKLGAKHLSRRCVRFSSIAVDRYLRRRT